MLGSHGLLSSIVRFPFVIILPRVDFLPADEAEDVIEARREQRPKEWTNPIDPVISGEVAIDHIGP